MSLEKPNFDPETTGEARPNNNKERTNTADIRLRTDFLSLRDRANTIIGKGIDKVTAVDISDAIKMNGPIITEGNQEKRAELIRVRDQAEEIYNKMVEAAKLAETRGTPQEPDQNLTIVVEKLKELIGYFENIANASDNKNEAQG